MKKQIKVSFTEITKLDFIACCALTFKFVHDENYLNYYGIFKRHYLFQITNILSCLNCFYIEIFNFNEKKKKIEVVLSTASFNIRWLRFPFQVSNASFNNVILLYIEE